MPKTFTQRYDEALAKERARPTEHEKAMDYIYQRVEDSDQPGVHQAFEETYGGVEAHESIMLDLDEDDGHGILCQKCKRTIEPYYEKVFVVGIYVNEVREAQEFWCKQCALKGMKGDRKPTPFNLPKKERGLF